MKKIENGSRMSNYNSKLPIYIPFKQNNAIGGPSTFMSNLKHFLEKKNITLEKDINKSKLIFFPISYNLRKLKEIKKNNIKIIQRLDGVYYPSQHGLDYIYINRKIKKIYLKYSDFIIFQSEYSKSQCYKIIGNKQDDQYSIIINGVNKEIFYPSKEKIIDKEFILTTSGVFRKKVMLIPIIKALDNLKNKYKFKLKIIGPIIEKSLLPYLSRDYIIQLGPKTKNEVANILRDSNIYIHSQLNDNCPNSVLEALSCGLPIVGFNSGSMGELLFFSKELLAFVNNKIIHKKNEFIWERLSDKLELLFDKYLYFKDVALENSSLYSFDQCGAKYLEIFNRFVS